MKTLEFPYCCTAKIIADFGESDIAEGGNYEVTYDSIKDGIIKKYKDWYNQNLAMFVIITNSEQITTNTVLEDLEFMCSDWMSKPQHANTQVKLWWKPLH